jgi:hypothetical protein
LWYAKGQKGNEGVLRPAPRAGNNPVLKAQRAQGCVLGAAGYMGKTKQREDSMTAINKLEISAVIVAAAFLIFGNIFWAIMFLGVGMICASFDVDERQR